MRKGKNMKKTTDTKEKGVTIRLIIIVLLIDFGLISAWVYGVIKTENSQVLETYSVILQIS